MPDPDGNIKAEGDATPDTSLHAYKEGRTEDMKGDTDKVLSNNPQDQQQSALEGEDELDLPSEKH